MGLTSCYFRLQGGYSATLELGCSKLRSVSLLWINLNAKAWMFTSDIIHKAGQERTEKPLSHSCLLPLPKRRVRCLLTGAGGVFEDIRGSPLPSLYNHKSHLETLDHTSSGQRFFFSTRIHLNATFWIPGSIFKLPLILHQLDDFSPFHPKKLQKHKSHSNGTLRLHLVTATWPKEK